MDLEFCSLAHSGTQMDGAVVGGDDPLHDGKSHSGAVFFVGDERAEDFLLLFGRDSASVVFHSDHQPFVMSEYLEGDASALGDGFHGVLDQVEERLLQTDGISVKSG